MIWTRARAKARVMTLTKTRAWTRTRTSTKTRAIRVEKTLDSHIYPVIVHSITGSICRIVQ